MIWLRRVIAALLVPLFFVSFLLVLFVFRINATFGNPQFYIEELRKADVYNFIYDELLPAALEEAKLDTGPKGPRIDFEKLKGPALTAARQTLPPSWIQAQVEQSINQVFPYLLGDTEGFAITIDLRERVDAAGEAIKGTFLEKDTFSSLYEPMVAYAADQGVANLDKLPFPLALSRQDLDSALRTLVPQEWLLRQTNQAVDELVPYLTGRSEHLAIRMELKDRLEAAGDVVIRLLGRQETYDFLLQEMVAPVIKENVGQVVQLPFGVDLSDEEVLSAVKTVLPQPWVKERLEDLVHQLVAYLEGQSDAIAVVVPLADRKAAALDVLTSLSDRKLRELLESLPQCSPQQLQRLLAGGLANGQPECRLAGISYEQLREMLGIDMGGAVSQLVGEKIPNEGTFTDADLRRAIGDDKWNALTKARQQIIQGWTFTDTDLRRALGTAKASTLDDIRGQMAQGLTFTEQDLREQMAKGGNGEGRSQLQDFDRLRHRLAQGRRWLFAAWAVPGLLLTIIGLLGGTSWRSKAIWAAAVLAFAAFVVLLASGPLYSSIARPTLDSRLARGMGTAEGVAAVAMGKAIVLAENVADDFFSGIRTQALVILLVAVAGSVLAITWDRLPIRGKPKTGQQD